MSLFEYASQKKLKLFVSALSLNNINYIIRKAEPAEKSKSKLIALLNLIEVLPAGKTTVKKSLFSQFKNFEDGLQNFCAGEARIGTIITSNIKNYLKSEPVVQTPEDFLAEFEMPNP